ncbi:MAG: hypothetical protein K6U80_02600 [Firmicutes bacterium]|nr:hypothetical protein [Bacillota bacterium]
MRPKRDGYRQGLILLLVILVLAASGCGMMKSYQQVMAEKQAKYPDINLTQRISLKELREDLGKLITTLEAVHPHPYTVLSRKSFHDSLERLNQSLGGDATAKTAATPGPSKAQAAPTPSGMAAITVRDFYLKLAPLLTALEQDYTCLLFPDSAYRAFQSRNGKLFPFEVAVAGEKLKVKTNYSSKPIAPGAEIESINGVPAGGIITDLLRYCEGSTLSLRRQRLSMKFQALLWLVYDFQEPYTISIETRWVPVSGVTSAEILEAQRRRSKNTAIPDGVDYQPLGEAVGLLTISNFNEEDFSLKLQNIFAGIAQSRIKDLIVDLRDSRGGGPPQVGQFADYFLDRPYVTISGMEQKRSQQYDQQLKSLYYWWAWPVLRLHPSTKAYFQTQAGQIAFLTMAPRNPKPLKPRFKGKIYVLIGPNTNSAGTEFATVIKDYRAGVLIGQTTGASANEYGNPYEFILPHSHLRVSAATSFYIRPSGDRKPGGVTPDIEVALTPDENESSPDPLAQDPVLETAKKIIALDRKKI